MRDPARDLSSNAPPPRRPWTVIRDALENEREYWFVFFPVLFGIGIGLYFALPAEPPLWTVATAVVLAAIAYAGARGGLALALGVILIATMGAAVAKVRTEWVRAPVLEKRLGPVEVRGTVVLVEPTGKRGQRLTLDVTAIEGLTPDRLPRRVRIRTMVPLAAVKPGDAVRLRATLSPPGGPVVPAGYDYARTAWYMSLGAAGYSLSAPQRDAQASPTLALSALIARVRQDIGARVVAALPGETGAIANALITGERGGISQATNDAYRDAGIYHILSISGLHMVIMAGTVFFVVRLLLAAIPRVALYYPIKKWAAVAAALAALAYLLISGSAFATVRSYIMISIMFAAVLLDRPAIAMRNVALAATVILLLYPESLLDVGFQMSFAAVVALIAAYEFVNARSDGASIWRRTVLGRAILFFAGIVLSTLVAGVAVAPLAAYHFHTSQQFAVLTNLLTIPICNLIVMPAALLALILMPLGLEGIPLALMGGGIDAMTHCARWTAALPGAVSHIRAMPLSAFLLMAGGGLWLTLWRPRWRSLGVVPIAAGLALTPMLPRPDLLVGRDGAIVAVRGDKDGRYAVLAARSSNFELKRWLEHDGDPREAKQATYREKDPHGFRCDRLGCSTSVKSRTIAVARHPAALRDDCERADILILDIPRPSGCDHPLTVIDFFNLRNLGTHAVYLGEGNAVRIETVADHRGDRPWAPRWALPQPRVTSAAPSTPAAAADAQPEAESDDGSADPYVEQD